MATNKENFEFIEEYLKNGDWYFETEINNEKDQYFIKSGINGENIRFPIIITCKNEDVIFTSILPNKFNNPANTYELIKHLLKINIHIIYGGFGFNEKDNLVFFKFRLPTDGITLNENLVDHLIMGSCIAIDDNANEIIKFA